ncbi:MAG: hypothetical protein KJ558_02725 [Gammaproteobacteria bacterium]|nr:hypothetical protein [Gammaproteobacteria bacterium]MBU1653740.1 hypothetical protein [Gammaproteobacteria bacterium]MBU1959617.1 hypothetical protein [Gammaproteobacteria bacterium]
MIGGSIRERVARPSNRAMAWFLGLGALLSVSLAHALWFGLDGADPGHGVELVRELGLSDLALFTEARYTRHLSLADSHAAFQDHPLALDHFPTASLAAPPEHLRNPHVAGD